MAEITAGMVKELREKTDAPMMECKKALTEADGDLGRAEEILRVKLGNKASKAAARITAEGVVSAAVDGSTGAIVEVNCETDFVARNEEFKAFVNDLALQIAAAKPSYVKREDIPAELVEKEKVIYEGQAKEMGKPPAAWPVLRVCRCVPSATPASRIARP